MYGVNFLAVGIFKPTVMIWRFSISVYLMIWRFSETKKVDILTLLFINIILNLFLNSE